MKPSPARPTGKTFSTARLIAVCAASSLLLAAACPAHAQLRTWDGSIGNWDTDANWLGGPEPTAADDAYINTGTVTISVLGEVADELRLGNTAGTSALNFINNGELTSNIGRIGYAAGSDNTVTLDGAATSWTDTAFVQVGFSGEGNLTISNGGLLTNPVAAVGVFNGSTGVVNVNTNGQWVNNGFLRIGEFGDGELNIASGGEVTNTIGSIGHIAGSSGTVTVGGADSIWNNTSGLYIGGSDTAAGGTGTLNVNAAGTVDVTGGPLKIWGGGAVNLSGGTINASGGLDNTSGGSLNHTGGNLNVTGGTFQPNAGGPTDDYTIDGAGVADNPTLTLGAGTSAAIGRDLIIGDALQGTLNVEDGVAVSNTSGIIGLNSGSTGTATVTGLNSTWTNTSLLFVGYSGTGTLNVEDRGAVENTIGYIGRNSGSTGTATVTGPNSTWTNTTGLYVGYSGAGTLNVEAGGAVENTSGYIGRNSGSTGTATVTGLNSTWTNTSSLSVGFSGAGTLNVEDRGAVENTIGYIGRNSGSTGTATVTGNGSLWDNTSSLYVGFSGAGTLNVEDGGAVENTSGSIGLSSDSTGTATVTGPNSTWTNTSSLSVGYFGAGTLNVEAGGAVSNTSGYIGRSSGSTGTATVTGPNSTWTNTTGLYVGGSDTVAGGTGTLRILDNGTVSVGGAIKIWGTGSVLLDGGTLSVGTIDSATFDAINFVSGTFSLTSDDLSIGSGGALGDSLFVGNSRTINVTNQATVEADGTLIVQGGFSAGTLTNNGEAIFINTTVGGDVINPGGSDINVVGNVVFTGNYSGGGGIFGSGTADFQGGFSPGDSPALVTVEGSVNLADTNTLTMELGGTTLGTDYDHLDIGGSLDIDGTLDIVFIDGFTASNGDTFDLFNAGSVTGTFDVLNLASLDAGLSWDTSNLYTTGEIGVVPEPTSLAPLALGGLMLLGRRRRAA